MCQPAKLTVRDPMCLQPNNSSFDVILSSVGENEFVCGYNKFSKFSGDRCITIQPTLTVDVQTA